MAKPTVAVGQLVAYGNSVGVVGTHKNLKGELLVHLFTANGTYVSEFLPADLLTPTPPAVWEGILEGEVDNTPAKVTDCSKIRYVSSH